MRGRVFWAMLIFLPCLVFAAELEFQAPTLENPYYRIHFQMGVDEDNLLLKGLRINGERWEYFLVFKDGKPSNLSKPLEKGAYEVSLDYAWTGKKEYEVLALLQPEGSAEIKEKRAAGISPEKGGIPAGREGFYRVFRLEETAGLRREAEISYLTLTVPKWELADGEFIILDRDSQVDYQVLDTRESVVPESAAQTHPSTLTCKIAIPVDISPHEKKLFLVLKGKKEPSSGQGFTVSGEGWGKRVKGKKVALEFHPQSGQINIIEADGVRLYNEAGVIHWNPGVFIPGIAWDHSFDWNPPPTFEEKVGNMLYTSSRRGPLQRIKDVNLEVRYTLEADAPYFISETMLTVIKDLGVIAVRNDEMVLYKELFDTLVYREKNGKIVTMPLKEKEGMPYGLVHIAPDDLDWVGLVNTREKYGFFSLRINYTNTSFSPSGTWLHKPGTYFYAPSDGKYVYWVRPLLYTWSEFLTNNLFTFVPEGSTFYEKNAYIILPFTKGYARKLNNLLKGLKSPVRIF